MKKFIFLLGVCFVSASFAEWRLDEGSGLISTNLSLSGASLIGESIGKSGDQLVQMESSSESVATTNETTITPEIRALADALGNDPLKILDYVRDNIQYIPRVGVYLDARGCLLAGRGSDWDQAVLLTSLLRAAGYATRYVKGLVLYYDSDLLYQFDMNTFSAWDDMRVKRDLVYYSYDAYSGAFLRVWVECQIDGVWQTFDPTFKEYDSHTPADLKTAMQYNFSSFTNTALSGATRDANYVKNLNESNIRSALNTYRTNLNDYFRAGTAYTATYEALGIRTIIQQESTDYQDTVPPYSLGVFSLYLDYWDEIPANCHTKVNVQHAGINVSLNAWEVAGRRLSILYDGADGNRPFLSLDGKEIARGTTTTAGSTNTLNLSVIQPILLDGSSSNIANVTNSVDMQLISGSTYVLIHDFESTSEKVQAVHRRLFTRDRQVESIDSEAVSAGALQLVADSYLNQHDQYWRLVAAIMNSVADDRYFLGILASTPNGYFIDLPGLRATLSSKTADSQIRKSAFALGTFISSSLEHGVLEQNQGVENQAVSTIKLLQLCNESGKKIFYVHSNNWSSVQGQLLNYSSAEKTSIQTDLTAGAVGYIPEDAHITLSNWTGIGYAMESSSFVLMAIAGGYDGGYNASGSSFSIPAVEETQGHSTANNYVANVSCTFSVEPVNLFTGDYAVDHTDLSLGGSAPMGMRFARHYNSANRSVRNVPGNGWQHNLEIQAFEVSQGADALSSDRALDVASALVQLTVAKDL
ncbi:MAG: transglutaminase domain-containing protein, partial [Kiritimatiellales bacterium]